MKAILAQVVSETPTVATFKLQTDQLWPWAAGQWMYVSLPQLMYPDPRGAKRHFTISSSPTEGFVQFTTRLTQSGYKRSLFELSLGAELDINGPFGNFVLNPADGRLQLFLAGGIGITPFRSLLKYITDTQSPIAYQLIYSVKTRDDIVFASDVDRFGHHLINISSETGHITAQTIRQFCPQWQDSTWWVCGPPAMVTSLVDLASQMGVEPGQLKSEEFTGY